MQAQLNRFQFHINTIPAVLYALGLREAVISPGSRNAPLIMAFNRFGKIRCISALDERSAAFVALGIAKSTGRPCAAVCTSGSAVANYYPAVLEAFYMQVPLLVISADRPPEMIDRWDGQTIHQPNLFHPHIKASFQYPLFHNQNETEVLVDICSDFYKAACNGVKGPAHLNVPMAEPLYEAVKEDFEYPELDSETYSADVHLQQTIEDADIIAYLQSSKKLLYLIGADNIQNEYKVDLARLNGKIPVLADILSCQRTCKDLLNWESAMINMDESSIADYMPEVLITSGKMLLNKKLKQLMRLHPPKLHLHIEPNGYCADTFFSNPKVLRMSPRTFFEFIKPELISSDYYNIWSKLCADRAVKESNFNWDAWAELTAIREVIKALDQGILHLANSMSVRNVAYLSQYLSESVKVHSNRGVSGIDGCTSTAIGMALADKERQHVLITGDLAFLYDNNAFLTNELPDNLKILVLNNDGGGIFTMIEGPAAMKELHPFMTTPHHRNLKHLSDLHVIKHTTVDNMEELKASLKPFFSEPGLAILEIKTNQTNNNQIFNQFKH